MHLPNSDYQKVKDYIFSEHTCILEGEQNFIYCNCEGEQDPTFPIMTIQLGDKIFELESEHYLIYDEAKQMCLVAMLGEVGGQGNYWLLGDSFLRGFYSIYDVGNQRVGLVAASGDSMRS